MYNYSEVDQRLVDERVQQFRGQVDRRLTGEIAEDEFKPLRLQNGLYLQLHAYMLRVAVPYGTLSSLQMRKLAHIARRYDRGFGHFTTRQNIQYNWIRLEDAPDILAELASVQMHAFQTSGNCIRNITADHYAAASADEVDDARVWSEIVRQWSTLHPEFSFLPRKFKIAVSSSPADRAAVEVHDIGLKLIRNAAGEVGFTVLVGGGLGRTPIIGKVVSEFVTADKLLGYLEAILRVYNEAGRRDNIYKARIKILVQEMGIEKFRAAIDAEWERSRDHAPVATPEFIAEIRNRFTDPDFETNLDDGDLLETLRYSPAFAAWFQGNVAEHRQKGYAIVNISLKPIGGIPGDATADQIDGVADLADRYGHGEIRITHTQNLVLPHVRRRDLPKLWRALDMLGLAADNVGRATDIIACPGLDYCSLANARSIPVAQRLSERLAVLDKEFDLGPLEIKVSGCINACGHHHVGHIGLLGVDKNGEEFYQITLGGSDAPGSTIGTILGPAFSSAKVDEAVETIARTYLELRQPSESFLSAWRRLGATPFKERLYATA